MPICRQRKKRFAQTNLPHALPKHSRLRENGLLAQENILAILERHEIKIVVYYCYDIPHACIYKAFRLSQSLKHPRQSYSGISAAYNYVNFFIIIVNK